MEQAQRGVRQRIFPTEEAPYALLWGEWLSTGERARLRFPGLYSQAEVLSQSQSGLSASDEPEQSPDPPA
ncbi:MAG: hypothetical protein HY774_01910 [Acidobacteria bacterium]|nr:hypothetical protein [Acidobacteriota bacterium]